MTEPESKKCKRIEKRDLVLPGNQVENMAEPASKKCKRIEKKDLVLPGNQVGKLAFMLYNVMTEQECQEYIKKGEKIGFDVAKVNGGGRQIVATDIRNSDRCFWDTHEESSKIFDRIKEFIPTEWKGRNVIGLNERLRILRYDPGMFFAPHFDGTYVRDNGEKSYITMQLYLNEGFEGGSTTFLNILNNHGTEGDLEVVPKTGSVLIFEHEILHEGSELIKGRKYAIRSDIMYSAHKE